MIEDHGDPKGAYLRDRIIELMRLLMDNQKDTDQRIATVTERITKIEGMLDSMNQGEIYRQLETLRKDLEEVKSDTRLNSNKLAIIGAIAVLLIGGLITMLIGWIPIPGGG